MIKTGSLKDINNLIILGFRNKGLSITQRKNCAQFVLRNHLIGKNPAGENVYNLNYIDVTIGCWLQENMKAREE